MKIKIPFIKFSPQKRKRNYFYDPEAAAAWKKLKNELYKELSPYLEYICKKILWFLRKLGLEKTADKESSTDREKNDSKSEEGIK